MNDKSKFQEWYKKHREFNYDAVHAPMESKIAWEACKNEIIKILEREMDSGDWSLATATENIRNL